MGKGILLEREGRYGVVLTPTGAFQRVPVQPLWQVGDEVTFSETTSSAWRRWTTLAVAAVLLVLFLPMGWQAVFPQAVALITVDINPSVELAVDAKGRIISARGLNADGDTLLKVTGSLRGKDPAAAVQALTESAIETNKLDPNNAEGTVLVAVAPARASLSDEVAVRLQEQVQRAAEVSLERRAEAAGVAVQAQVVTVSASAEMRTQAKKDNVSVGKEVLKHRLQELDPDVTIELESLKSTPPAKLVREISKGTGVEVKLGELLGIRGGSSDKGKDPKGSERDPALPSYAQTPSDDKDRGKDDDKGRGKDDDKDRGKGDVKDRGKDDVKDRGKGDVKDRGMDDGKGRGMDDDKGRGMDDDKDRGKDDGKDRGMDDVKDRGKDKKGENSGRGAGQEPSGAASKGNSAGEGCIKIPVLGKIACKEAKSGKD